MWLSKLSGLKVPAPGEDMHAVQRRVRSSDYWRALGHLRWAIEWQKAMLDPRESCPLRGARADRGGRQKHC